MFWKPMSTLPADAKRPGFRTLVWHRHDSDPYFLPNRPGDKGRRLTVFGAHCEGLGLVEDGPHVAVWGGAWSDPPEDGGGNIPDWWFRYGSEFEEPLAPTHWATIIEGGP